jgi:vacuolar-type H+-ATPase subunit E/Vma4
MLVEGAVDFSHAVLEEAQQEAEGIVNLARREAERILESARAELDQVYLSESPQEKKLKAKTRYTQIVAAAELEAQRQLLLSQERMIAEVQQRVKERLPQIRNDSRYAEILMSLIRQGLTELDGSTFKVLVAPEDRQLVTDEMLTRLHEETGKTVQLSEQSQAGLIGAIIQRTDGRVMCDNSFQAILQRQQDEIRLLIAQELFAGIEEF